VNVVQLRKQAKELVAAARAGDREALVRLTDLPLRLSSAQLVLAREHGYSSWPSLIRGHTQQLDYQGLVEQLSTERWRQALEKLMEDGSAGSGAVREGLRHPDPNVRIRCCMVLDHHLDEAALPDLIANLEHADGRVRAWALHALACDRCKEGECRPGEDDTIPIALRLLRSDRSRKVRTMACGLLGPVAPLRPAVARALEEARDTDVHPVVRMVAQWYAPGGRNYAKTAAALGVGAESFESRPSPPDR
jgi:HEAT repeat protein